MADDTPPPSGWEPPPLPSEPAWSGDEVPPQPTAPTPPATPPPGATTQMPAAPQPPAWEPPPPPGATTQMPVAPQPPAASVPPPVPNPGPPPAPGSYPTPSPFEPPPPGAAPTAGYPATPSPPGGPQPFGGPGQPPPPAPGWGPPPPPAKKSYKSLWITLGVIFGVLLLAIGGCAFWFIGTVTAPVDEANDFLALVDRGAYAEAVASTDPGCNAGFSAADLESLFGGADIDYNLNNSQITNSSATVSGSFSAQGQSWTRIEVFLRNSGGWSVCGFEVNRG